MPARIHRNVKHKVSQALYHTALDYLLELADRHIAEDPWLVGEPLVVTPYKAFWTVARNIAGVSYVRALIRFSDGHEIERAWKMLHTGGVISTGGSGSLWIQNVSLDNYQKVLYAVRARGWALDNPGGASESPSRSRPEAGLAFKRRGRGPRSE